MVSYWYGMPDAKSNRPPMPELAAKAILTLPEMDRTQDWLRDSIMLINYDHLERNLGDLIRNPADHQQ